MAKNKSIDALIQEQDVSKYYNNYVAQISFKDHTIVSYGKNPVKVLEEAKKKGHSHPVIFYVLDPSVDHLFSASF
jgi:hypothetical protein